MACSRTGSCAVVKGTKFTVTTSAVCVGHFAGHLLFGDTPEYSSTPEGPDFPSLGTIGTGVKAESKLDGWGTVHLLDGKTLKEIDNYAIKERLDPAYATGLRRYHRPRNRH